MASNIEMVVIFDYLPEVVARFPGAIDTILSAGAQRIANYAISNHPWQNQTGATEGSIHMEKQGAHEFAVVFGGASLYLEYGTVHMAPYPFVQPAFDAVAPSIDASLSQLEAHLL